VGGEGQATDFFFLAKSYGVVPLQATTPLNQRFNHHTHDRILVFV